MGEGYEGVQVGGYLMKFAHFADIHLGYEQYNLPWRAEDFFQSFKRAAEIAVKEGVDFAIISGDLFHRNVPSPRTILEAIEVLRIFKEKGIPVFAIEGNHDKSMRESAYHLLENLGLLNLLGFRKERVEGDYLTSEKVEGAYLVKGVFKDLEIIGDKHRTKWQIEKILPLLKGGGKSILVLHQVVKEVVDIDLEMSWDITIDQLPEADYYAFGHVHMHREKRIGDSFLVYPGSLERYDSREASKFIIYFDRLEIREGEEKGFCLVENFRPRFVRVETRDLFSISVDAEKKEEAEMKFLEILRNLNKSAIAVAKIACSENLDSKKLLEIALGNLKHAEISVKRKGLEEIPVIIPERQFFNDFELKLLEILREEEEHAIKTAIEMIKEHLGFEKKEKGESTREEVKEVREEKRKRVTLFDFL
ncbi:MAG: exonuclease SbcCD subunit D [Archaeoglobi archaeon]|jgi:DNA repair exonuclease SbcCD nuclease subunit|nr:MAG: exonuclease SbcCD subunit D [Archaeoglobi archaeon]